MTVNKGKCTTTVYLLAACVLVSVSAMAQTKPVLIVNGTGQPVPTAAQGTTYVAGTVNIGNTPNVSVSNTPTVNLAAGTGVAVSNPLDGQNNPIPLAALDAIQPYEDSCFIAAGPPPMQCNFQQIPTGKRLVIQEFDADGETPTGVKPRQLFLRYENPIRLHFFTPTFLGTSVDGAGDEFATHQETHLYVGSGKTPLCVVSLNGTANFGGFVCNISGFLVDVP